MENNELMRELFILCDTYASNDQKLSPDRVKTLLIEAYTEGYFQGKQDSPKVTDGGEIDFPEID